jgi:hypothetical protein
VRSIIEIVSRRIRDRGEIHNALLLSAGDQAEIGKEGAIHRIDFARRPDRLLVESAICAKKRKIPVDGK